MAALACLLPACTPDRYAIVIGVVNNNTVPINLVVADNAPEHGTAIGTATPFLIEPHGAVNVELMVPATRDWALFVTPSDPFPAGRPVLTSAEAAGCRGRVPIELTFGALGGSRKIPDC